MAAVDWATGPGKVGAATGRRITQEWKWAPMLVTLVARHPPLSYLSFSESVDLSSEELNLALLL